MAGETFSTGGDAPALGLNLLLGGDGEVEIRAPNAYESRVRALFVPVVGDAVNALVAADQETGFQTFHGSAGGVAIEFDVEMLDEDHALWKSPVPIA